MAKQKLNADQLGTTGGVWQSYTPTWSNLTIGNATVVARYTQIGKTVRVRMYVALGSTSSVGTNVSVSLPVTAASYSGTTTIPPIGLSVYWNGTSASTGQVQWESTTLARLYVFLASGTYTTLQNLSSTIPTTWTTGNEIQLSFEYEAA